MAGNVPITVTVTKNSNSADPSFALSSASNGVVDPTTGQITVSGLSDVEDLVFTVAVGSGVSTVAFPADPTDAIWVAAGSQCPTQKGVPPEFQTPTGGGASVTLEDLNEVNAPLHEFSYTLKVVVDGALTSYDPIIVNR